MEDERIYYQDEKGVVVTDSKVRIRDKSLLLLPFSSVRLARRLNYALVISLFGLGVVFLFFAYVGWVISQEFDKDNYLTWIGVPLVFGLVLTIVIIKQNPLIGYSLILTSNNLDSNKILSSKDRMY